MMKSENNLDDIVSMLGLEERGIKVLVKGISAMRKLNKVAAGYYNPIWNEIEILGDIIPSWSATYTTVLHEFRHHMQRSIFLVSLSLLTLRSLVSWYYGVHVGSVFFTYWIPMMLAVSIILEWQYLEKDARSYETKCNLDVILFLSMLETMLIAHSLGAKKRAISDHLKSLKKTMQTYTPHLIEPEI